MALNGKKLINIRNLNSELINWYTCGIIIGKNTPAFFDSKDARRGTVSITIRDSKKDFVNCTIWGLDHFVETFCDTFHIGDCINVISPNVTLLPKSSKQLFTPITSSPYMLTVNEGISEIQHNNSENVEYFRDLLNIPLKSSATTLSISDVNSKVLNSDGEYVDLLVVVREIKLVREITTKKGELKYCRDVIVMDKTHPGILMTLWNPAHIHISNHWIPFQSILYLSDITGSYSEFYKSRTLKITGRTLITVNPKNHSELSELIENLTSTNDLTIDSSATYYLSQFGISDREYNNNNQIW